MRVLVLSNLYPPNAMGGYELSCRDVVDRWRQRGHEVTVLTTAQWVDGVVEQAGPEPHVRRVLQWYWSDHAFTSPGLRETIKLERANHAALAAALEQVRPDVVSVWHMGGMSLSLLTALEQAGVPWVGNVCDDWPLYGPRADAWSRRCAGWQRPFLSLAGVPTASADLDRAGHAFVSAFIRDQLRQRTRWQFPRSEIVGSGVDTVDFPIASAGADRPWKGRLLAVGRVEPRKGFATAVQALEFLPAETQLRIAGVAEPAHLADLHALARSVGAADRVQIEAVPRAALRQLYAEADAVLFPSSWEEPFGLVPLEAMTQATPVVATRRGGSAEFLVDGANCLAFPAGDPAALAAAVQRLAGDPALRLRLAEEGLRTAAGLTTDRLADVLERLHLAEVSRC